MPAESTYPVAAEPTNSPADSPKAIKKNDSKFYLKVLCGLFWALVIAGIVVVVIYSNQYEAVEATRINVIEDDVRVFEYEIDGTTWTFECDTSCFQQLKKKVNAVVYHRRGAEEGDVPSFEVPDEVHIYSTLFGFAGLCLLTMLLMWCNQSGGLSGNFLVVHM
jgi:hypothetical protein